MKSCGAVLILIITNVLTVTFIVHLLQGSSVTDVNLSKYNLIPNHAVKESNTNTTTTSTTSTPSNNNKRPYEKYLRSVWRGNQTCTPPAEGDDSDLPKHGFHNPRFSCDDEISDSKHTEAALLSTTRKQLHIVCDYDNVTGDVTTTTGTQRLVGFHEPLQTFESAEEVGCLHQYIYQHCYDQHPVPDVIHLLWYGQASLKFRNAIGLYSVLTVARPCLVLLHGDVSPSGSMWDSILPAASRVVRVVKLPQMEVNGTKITKVQNQADIGRIDILLEYGGIYLDSDMVITKKLDIFRDVQFAANKAGSFPNLANGIMISVPGQDLLQEWLSMWQTYNGESWNSHSVLLITKLAKKYPHRIQALGPIFIKFGAADLKQMFVWECSLEESFAAHIYIGGYPKHYLPISKQFEYVKYIKTTFGRLARFVLFGDPKLCD